MSSNLKKTIQAVESALAKSYGFSNEMSVVDYLLDFEAARQLKSNERGAVLIYQDPKSDDLEVGVYFDPTIIDHLKNSNPLESLHADNLDAFCVLIEEISHFHLVTNRAQKGRGVSRLELEWQGEIDKVLLAGNFLLQQTGFSHLPQLAQLIFDHSVCYSKDEDLYEEAVHYAARHWYQLIADFKGAAPKQQWVLACHAFRTTYDLQWSDKLSSLQSRKIKNS